MKSVFYLAAAVCFLLLTAFACEECQQRCYAMDYIYMAEGDRPDSIVNIIEGDTYALRTIGQLPVNPEKTSTTFLFYSSRIDTLTINYKYTELYDDACGRYIFQLEWAEAAHCTFAEFELRNGHCIEFSVEEK